MDVVTLKVAEVDPAGIMTLTGVAAILGFELDSMIVAPPLEAVVDVPLVTVFGDSVTADSATPHDNGAPAPPNAKAPISITPAVFLIPAQFPDRDLYGGVKERPSAVTGVVPALMAGEPEVKW